MAFSMTVATPRENRRRQRGALSLDMLFVVLALIALVSLALYNAPRLMEAVDRLVAENQLAMLVTNIRNTYNGNYSGITTGDVVGKNLVPPGMTDSTTTSTANGTATTTTTLNNRFHGAVSVGVDSGTLSGYLTVGFAGIPKASCLAMVNDNGGAIAIQTSGSSASWTMLPVDPADATSYCTSDVNTLVWAYR